ncbi:hypothetical protein ACFQ4C_03595 [Larkinella insperata]|uniref:YD repeat-containing protein n=1 Tax=Larkinella insperata TaxID=332158 RepID=A0ABW3Q3N3_9BACT|nr:hypothetical protein [Larkinella insperata]
MNTTKSLLSQSSAPQPTRRSPFSGKFALVILGALTVAACNRSATELAPRPGNAGKPSVDTVKTPGKPQSDSTTTNPGKPSDPKPGDSTGTGDPVSVYKSMKISYSALDFQEVKYDAKGTPVQYASQYMFNQGTGEVKRMVYDLQYDANQRLIRLDQTNYLDTRKISSTYTLYHYTGNQVARTEEFAVDGTLLVSRTYRYSAAGQLVQLDHKSRNFKNALRRTFQYDGTGNLTTMSDFYNVGPDGGYELELAISFADYDHQKHVENLMANDPFLPSVTFRVNNYHTKIVRSKDGKEISRQTVDYAYNAEGLPIQRTTHGAGGTLTATYTY